MLEYIDETIASLIKAMNKIPYIETLSCCGGHPEESAVREYGYAVANVIFEIKDEPQNLIRWYFLIQRILMERKQITPKNEFAYIIEKKFSLGENDQLIWEWELKIQATGKTPEQCRMGLDEGITFLTGLIDKIMQETK